MLRPDLMYIQAMHGRLSLSRAFFLVTIAYCWIMMILLVFLRAQLKLPISDYFIMTMASAYQITGVYGSLRCSSSVQWLVVRWLARLLLCVYGLSLIITIHTALQTIYG